MTLAAIRVFFGGCRAAKTCRPNEGSPSATPVEVANVGTPPKVSLLPLRNMVRRAVVSVSGMYRF